MEPIKLVIGNKNYSSWSLRPWIVLKYFKIPFEEIFIALWEPGFKEQILKYSPAGKVPILIHGSTVIWESIAICEYLSELFPSQNLWPRDPKARAQARAISAEMHAGFMDMRKNFPMNIKEHRPDKERGPEVLANVKRVIEIWDNARRQFKNAGPYLFGAFSIADAMYAPVVWRFKTYGVPLSGLAKEYYDTMLACPPMKEWQEAALNEIYVIAGH